MASCTDSDADKPTWLEQVWMEVQDEIDAEERMDEEDDGEDTNVEDSYAR
jgi:hypothetical protein